MASCGNQQRPSSSTSSSNEQSPPTVTTRLMSENAVETQRYELQRWVFSTSNAHSSYASGRFHSPRITSKRSQQLPNNPPPLVRSLSEDVFISSQWSTTQTHHATSGGPSCSTSKIISHRPSSIGEDSSQGHRRSQSSPDSPFFPNSQTYRSPSFTSHTGSIGPTRSASVFADVRPPILSRSSTRRSFGREWTRSHWEKVRDLELESERARRCSKLSSGFAPLMVFGGLVFICIGVSAATNTGADQKRLQNLSAAPMAMGVFMLALGIFLIVSWFGCKGRAKVLEQRLLHGSRRNSVDDNLVQNLLSKLSATVNGNSRQQMSSPTLPGVTLDGVDVLKPQSDNDARREVRPANVECQSTSSACCTHCGAANSTQIILETST